jgi:hypothetical protein
MQTPPSPSGPALTVREPRDVVALVPYQLGFVPQDSLVLVAFGGPAGRLGVVLRADLDDVVTGDPHRAREVAGYLEADGADRAVAVLYLDDVLVGVPTWLDVLDDALAERGVDLVDCWHVDGEVFRSLLCRGQGCCPPQGWPLAHAESSVVSAHMVGLGRSPVATRAQLLPDLEPAPEPARRRVAARVRRATAGPLGATARLRHLRAWQRCLGAGGVQDGAGEADVAGVLAALDDPWTRDAVVLTLAGVEQVVVDELALCGPTERTDAALDQLFGAAPGPALSPADEVLRAGREVLLAAARLARGPRRADPLAVLAWASWWSGDGALARDLVEVALRARRDHGLARLVADALDTGTPPAWARARARSAAARTPGTRARDAGWGEVLDGPWGALPGD